MEPNTTKNLSNTALLAVSITLVGLIPDFLRSQDYISASISAVVGLAVIFLYSKLP